MGKATAVNFGTGAYGSRSVVLTYNAGPRPGIYRFENGRLLEMDRVEGLPPSAEKKATKKKPAKSGEAKSGVRTSEVRSPGATALRSDRSAANIRGADERGCQPSNS